MRSYKLMGGLGDCLLIGAILERLNESVIFETHPLLEPIFKYHPTIKLGKLDPQNGYEFRWPSQIDNKLFRLHTMQRFAHQIGEFIDPTDVLRIYNQNGRHLINNGKSSTIIAVNQYSSEGSRRCIPDEYIDLIEQVLGDKYTIQYIGSNSPKNSSKSITHIPDIINLLIDAKMFIGPVSFCYHLASCLHVPSILFTSYMPPHKYSHFFNTTSIGTNSPCLFKCEEERKSCISSCGAFNYDRENVIRILEKI